MIGIGTPISHNRHERILSSSRWNRSCIRRNLAPPTFVKRDSRCVGNVQALHTAPDGDQSGRIAILTHQAPKTGAFGAKHKRHVTIGDRGGEGLIGVAGKRDAPEAGCTQLLQCPRDIDDRQIRHKFKASRRRLGERAGLGWGVPVLHNHG